MTGFLATIGLPQIVAGVMMLGLNAYVLTGGADFGGGVWDLLARGPSRDRQRALIASTIGPIWEANHVWLILVVVLLFTGFPHAFASLAIVLHIPLALMLVGIVLRGSSFVFRSYGSRADSAQRRWSRVFAIASVITPILLGVMIGAITMGAVGRAAARLEAAPPPTFASIFVAPWLAPFPFALGALALAIFAFLAAVYLALAATDVDVREAFRRRALGAGGAVFVAAFVALAISYFHAPELGNGLMMRSWSLPFQGLTAAAALTALWALWSRRFALARLAAGAQVSLILWGWALAQYPMIIPPGLTIRDAAAPRITLELLLWGCAGGFAILLPSLAYLFRTFAAPDDDSATDVRER
jgi:cytochrome d ubiquinol oxidase subunit II